MPASIKGTGVRARVTVAFKGVEDGQVYPRQISVGEIIHGDLALAAIGDGRAEPFGETTTVETLQIPFPTGLETPSSSLPLDQASGKKTSKPRKPTRARASSQSTKRGD